VQAPFAQDREVIPEKGQTGDHKVQAAGMLEMDNDRIFEIISFPR
jgi:hypothetical protein